ncbi:MAG: IS30 family transposase [Alphaproteobacteria bacterium]|nr:IS30 family transposase [Alphaproteobacteria bacterium]
MQWQIHRPHSTKQSEEAAKRIESYKHSKWRNSELLYFIANHLKMKWSPEIISHALSENGIKFSHTSIYAVIKKHRPEWRKLLIHQGKKLKHKASVGKIINRASIEKRPKIVDSRKRFGNWEADTVVSCRGGKSCLAVFVERRSRLYRLAKMKDKSAGKMLTATIRTLKNQGVKTMTYDNGTENANHGFANSILNCKSFFCNGYRSWEKSSIENRNKILRQFFPKGSNFDLISEGEIHKVQKAINDRPMKALNCHSPAGVFALLRSGY